MPAVQRQGDLNSAGGAATGGVASVRANGRPVVVNGTGVSAHAPWGPPHPPHAAASTTGGSGSVRANGNQSTQLAIRTPAAIPVRVVVLM